MAWEREKLILGECVHRKREVSMHMKVSAEQFVVDGEKLAHSPTGATFWLGEKDVALCDAGNPDLASGHDYKIDELKNEAWHIIVARKAGNLVPAY
jgi:hypothetical protein